jgi:hypothetical protein
VPASATEHVVSTEHATPASHSECTQTPTLTSPPEMMHVLPAPHWASDMQSIELGVQPASAPPAPLLLVVSWMPVLDDADPFDVLPPVAPLAVPAPVPAAVDIEVAVEAAPLLRFAVLLHAENAPNSTNNPLTRPPRILASVRAMSRWSRCRARAARQTPASVARTAPHRAADGWPPASKHA